MLKRLGFAGGRKKPIHDVFIGEFRLNLEEESELCLKNRGGIEMASFVII